LVKVHISSSSHPFFTGEERIVDVEGRVDRFKERQAKAQKARETRAAAKPKAKKDFKNPNPRNLAQNRQNLPKE
jgi:hypothetical protein